MITRLFLFIFQKMEDWYQITGQELSYHGGDSLLNFYHRNLPKALEAVYPEYQWLPWKFPKLSKHLWDKYKNIQVILLMVSKSTKSEALS